MKAVPWICATALITCLSLHAAGSDEELQQRYTARLLEREDLDADLVKSPDIVRKVIKLLRHRQERLELYAKRNFELEAMGTIPVLYSQILRLEQRHFCRD
ncbi:MAG: hypothetical protein A2977_02205 [Alphaproteobacteria bacterium RIFCSPLOWO2_01_FULL_45_8]|nr:MAG: hypothetical protein A3K20_01415 [Alphaproteobacteria bacterium GWA1_45_9]OFW89889.1 MAG: hypothetical protein A2621_03300 [Alphaproteobacteria bacterium RIFCSPHIGHO2_01_FULL_41_14]OFW96471.1 MAG: hypothetical protein A2977_02205 [Alphaproteobacteria bacterium RIFCSPLOWO2_01_FULL_45_8]HLB58499.1 hypothetical protein [Bdellovibrionota bacterium]